MIGRSDTEMAVSQWYCGEEEVHASNSLLKTVPEVQGPLFFFRMPQHTCKILGLPIHIT